MLKALLFSCEPGGAEVIIPVARLLAEAGGYETMVTGYGHAIERFEREGLSYALIDRVEKDDASFLRRFAPDLVITSAASLPAKDMSEKNIWGICRMADIRTIALLDQWQNYSLRFSGQTPKEHLAYLPDAINCIDGIGKQEMIEEGFDRDILHPLGHPYLDRLHRIAETMDRAAIREKFGIAAHEHVLLFVSEAIEENYGVERGYTQYDALKVFLSNIAPAAATSVLVKLHPKDRMANFSQIQAAFPRHKLAFIAGEFSSLECILMADKVIGMSSIMLVEAYILGKQVVSIQPGLKVTDPFVLSRLGCIATLRDREFELNSIGEPVPAPGRTGRNKLGYVFLRKEFLSLVNQMMEPSYGRRAGRS